jgi:uncharacterized membrane protein
MINLSNWIHSVAGAFHVIMAFVGLLTGAYLLLAHKGTIIHKKIGYLFTIALITVNISALFIYDFNHGKASIFHYLIIVSMFFLIFGLYPMLLKNKKKGRIKQHFTGMIGAALGLWAAGATEYFVRELSKGLNAVQLILYSFAISLPFGILIGWSIWHFVHRTKWGKL